ncbi:hypothetical protein E4U21_002394 [Claviceps maximensis]|nr:hypothetical protein E4U21_002394 [Claviceps maximensis]
MYTTFAQGIAAKEGATQGCSLQIVERCDTTGQLPSLRSHIEHTYRRSIESRVLTQFGFNRKTGALFTSQGQTSRSEAASIIRDIQPAIKTPDDSSIDKLTGTGRHSPSQVCGWRKAAAAESGRTCASHGTGHAPLADEMPAKLQELRERGPVFFSFVLKSEFTDAWGLQQTQPFRLLLNHISQGIQNKFHVTMLLPLIAPSRLGG